MNETLTFRRATAADAAAARNLTREAYSKWIPVIGREPKPMTADFDAAIRDHRVDLLCEGERIVALIETIAEPEALLIENVAASPACQGRGLGRRLMAHAERLAAAMGYGEVRLYTNARFVDNVAFYQRLGYAITREAPYLGGRIVHMSKTLGAT
jgi:ribosomal protein S18 acetylase RimI-like enzyme